MQDFKKVYAVFLARLPARTRARLLRAERDFQAARRALMDERKAREVARWEASR